MAIDSAANSGDTAKLQSLFRAYAATETTWGALLCLLAPGTYTAIAESRDLAAQARSCADHREMWPTKTHTTPPSSISMKSPQ